MYICRKTDANISCRKEINLLYCKSYDLFTKNTSELYVSDIITLRAAGPGMLLAAILRSPDIRSNNPMKTVIVTGVAGLIGQVTAVRLLEKGYRVIGIDNMNDYYDIRLKEYRLKTLESADRFSFHRIDIEDRTALESIETGSDVTGIINLAARAGVRYSKVNPFVYFSTNTTGTLNLLDFAVKRSLKKFVLASTSSLYAGQPTPFTEDLPVNEPISPYAASKKGAEAICYTYSYLYDLDVTVCRYFTVYGPAARPDMSIFPFIRWIDNGVPITLFGDGSQQRDFTYVDDIAEGTVRALETETGFEVINLGGSKPHELNYIIKLMEDGLGKKAVRDHHPFEKTDMKVTWADISKAKSLLNWEPEVSVEEGIARTITWHKDNRKLVNSIILK